MDLVSTEERNCASKNIEKINLRSFFEKESHRNWLNSILEIEDRENMHPIFWLLQEEDRSHNLTNCLAVLKENCIKYDTIIKKLIKDDFESQIAEIEVMAYFYDNFEPDNVEHDPQIIGTEKKPDLKIFFKGKRYYVEICVLKDDQVEQKRDNIESKILKKIRAIELPCFISLLIEDSFEEENIDEFIKFVKNLLNQPIKEDNYFYKNRFYKNREILATVYMEKINGKGLATRGHMKTPNIFRVKNKLLDKLEHGQLPINEHNILIVKIKDMFARSNSTLEQAFYGQYLDVNGQKTNKSNGFVHNPQSNNISAVIFYKNNFEERKLYLNPNAKKPIDNEIKSKLNMG